MIEAALFWFGFTAGVASTLALIGLFLWFGRISMRRGLLVIGILALTASVGTAGVTHTVRQGGHGWADVVGHPDGFAFVYDGGAAIVAEVNGAVRWRAPLPERILYLRACADGGGRIFAVAQGGETGNALLASPGGVSILGRSFGQNATACGWTASAGFQAYVQTSPTSYDVITIDGGARRAVAMPMTSQGFRDIHPNGDVLLGDAHFSTTVRGYALHHPNERDGVVVGQWSKGRVGIGVVHRARELAYTAIPGEGFEPHLVVRGETIAVAARTPLGATLAVISPPYPANEAPGGVVTPPPPPPQGEPDRTAAKRIVDQERAKFGPMDREQLAQFVKGVAAALNAAQLAGGPFGVLKKTSGSQCAGYACDIVCAGNGSAQRQWDILSDSDPGGAQAPTWSRVTSIAVRECEIVSSTPPPPPPPPDDLEALKARLAAIEAWIRSFPR